MAGRGRLHLGRRTASVPPEWGAAHRPVVELAWTAGVCSIRRPGSTRQVWSDTEESMVATPYPPYVTDAPCRAVALTGQARTVATAEDTETEADWLVQVALDHDVQPGHLVTVACDDAALAGRLLQVARVGGRTHAWGRDLWCTHTD